MSKKQGTMEYVAINDPMDQAMGKTVEAALADYLANIDDEPNGPIYVYKLVKTFEAILPQAPKLYWKELK